MSDPEIDWSVPIDASAYHIPPRLLPLYGTPLWDQMSEDDRRDYSRHEACAHFASGMWFENILINALMRHLYHMPATDPRHRKILVEVREEAQHSEMFGEFIRRAGTPAYLPSLWLRLQGGFMKLTGTRATFYIAILGAESLLDRAHRQTLEQTGLHPTYQSIVGIHVREEQHHMEYAREYLTETWPGLNILLKVWAKFYAPLIIFTIVQSTVCEELYFKLGMMSGYKTAWENPIRRRAVIQSLESCVKFLEGIGVIDFTTRWLWRSFGLMA